MRQAVRTEQGRSGLRPDQRGQDENLISRRHIAQAAHSGGTVVMPDHRRSRAAREQIQNAGLVFRQRTDKIISRRKLAQHGRIGEQIAGHLDSDPGLHKGVQARREAPHEGYHVMPCRCQNPVGMAVVADDEAPEGAALDDRNRHGTVHADVPRIRQVDGRHAAIAAEAEIERVPRRVVAGHQWYRLVVAGG
jgi:hypothetical protein